MSKDVVSAVDRAIINLITSLYELGALRPTKSKYEGEKYIILALIDLIDCSPGFAGIDIETVVGVRDFISLERSCS